jgi:hypothetical protein
VNATAENAEAFLAEIVGHYLRNPRIHKIYRTLYHTVPLDPRAAKTKSLVLNTRTCNFSEPSIGTIGALGNLVSAHYDLIIVDDLCNIDDRESPTVREKKKRWFKDLVSVLSPDGELVIVGTHWHFDDVYSYIKNELKTRSCLSTLGITSTRNPAISMTIRRRGSRTYYQPKSSARSRSRKARCSSPVSTGTSRCLRSTRSSGSKLYGLSRNPKSISKTQKRTGSAILRSA